MNSDAPGRPPAPRVTFWRTALQPRWIALLLATLAVGALFTGLSRWQIESAIQSAQRPQQSAGGPAEPLGDHLEPQRQLYERSIGAAVRFAGVLDPADLEVLPGRLQGDRHGAWVISRVHVTSDEVTRFASAEDPAAAPGLAVALGWAPDEPTAQAAVEALRSAWPSQPGEALFEGVLEYPQAPAPPKSGEAYDRLEQMSPAYLANRWSVPSPSAYSAYVVLESAAPFAASPELAQGLPSGLEPIQRQLVDAGGQLNWLNIFYAIEWIIFAGFALYLWWRLVRDDARSQRAALRVDRTSLEEEIRRERLRAIRDARAAGPSGGAS